MNRCMSLNKIKSRTPRPFDALSTLLHNQRYGALTPLHLADARGKYSPECEEVPG